MSYVVVAREDLTADGMKGEYTLCTRRLFMHRKDAETYASTLSPSREPIVVGGRFTELYWPPPGVRA